MINMAKKTSNIDFMMNFVKSFVDGDISAMEFTLDFNYYVIQKFAKMERENPEYAEVFNYYIIEDGYDVGCKLSDDKFHQLMSEQYLEVLDIANSGFY